MDFRWYYYTRKDICCLFFLKDDEKNRYLFILINYFSCTASNNQQSVEDKSFRESVLLNTVDNIIIQHVNLLTNLESLQTQLQ